MTGDDEADEVDGHDDGPPWPNLPRRYITLAIVGWFVVAAAAYGVALLAGWSTLTDLPRPLILLVVGPPYWLAIIFFFDRTNRRRSSSRT